MATLSKEQLELLNSVLDYVNRHPDAKDTLEGIAEWWLPPRGPRPSREELRTVLQYLVSAGYLVAIDAPAGAVYGVRRDPPSGRPH